MEELKPLGLDGAGFNILKDAVLALLNDYPGLDDREITFSGLTADSGISIEPESGALIYTEKKDIIGNVYQQCQFPFYVVYRTDAASEFAKKGIVAFLDTLGAWVCREPVIIRETLYQLTQYPELSGNRKITGITRFNSYALEPKANNTQDWLIPITVNDTHEFTLW